jgi:hypothetical protein
MPAAIDTIGLSRELECFIGSVKEPCLKVEYESDPQVSGRTAIRISAPDRESIEREIDRVMSYVEAHGGYANFVGPCRISTGYGALGDVIIFRLAECASAIDA